MPRILSTPTPSDIEVLWGLPNDEAERWFRLVGDGPLPCRVAPPSAHRLRTRPQRMVADLADGGGRLCRVGAGELDPQTRGKLFVLLCKGLGTSR